jgi:hypothetical protein
MYGCSKVYRINEQDKSLNPYKGSEVLKFKSTSGQTDTIFLTGIEQVRIEDYYSKGNLTFSPPILETLLVKCQCPDPYYEKRLTSFHLQIGGDYHLEKTLTINGTLGRLQFRKGHMSLHKFRNHPVSTIVLNNRTYDDVKVFTDSSKQNSSKYAHTLYWSVSKGLVGLKSKNENWIRISE